MKNIIKNWKFKYIEISNIFFLINKKKILIIFFNFFFNLKSNKLKFYIKHINFLIEIKILIDDLFDIIINLFFIKNYYIIKNFLLKKKIFFSNHLKLILINYNIIKIISIFYILNLNKNIYKIKIILKIINFFFFLKLINFKKIKIKLLIFILITINLIINSNLFFYKNEINTLNIMCGKLINIKNIFEQQIYLILMWINTKIINKIFLKI